MSAALAAEGVLAPALELVRRGTNEIFRDSTVGLVVRVSSSDSLTRVQHSMRVAAAVADAGGPVVAPLSSAVIPVEDDAVATLWPMGEELEALDGSSFGSLLRRLHDVPPPPMILGWDVTARIHQRLAVADTVEGFESYAEFLRGELTVALSLVGAAQRVEDVLIHGDAHTGNVVLVGGEPRFVDLDDLALGPREADFAPLLIAIRRFGRDPGELVDARRIYGRELDERLLDAFGSLRQVTMTSWLLSVVRWRPEAEEELRHRLRSWNSSDRWTPL